MSDPGAIYLLEAYATASGRRPASAEELRAEVESHDGLRVIGLLFVPVDEAVLCLVAADSGDSETAVREIAERYGPAGRLLRVSWAPAPSRPATPEPAT